MDLRLLMILGLLGYGAYKAFGKPRSTGDDDELTAEKRAELIAKGFEVEKLTPAEIQLVWQFKYYEGMGNWREGDKLVPQIKEIIRKYGIAL